MSVVIIVDPLRIEAGASIAIQQNKRIWLAADARARFSEVIVKAILDGPQHVTRNARKAVVIISGEELDTLLKSNGTGLDMFKRVEFDGDMPEFPRYRSNPPQIDL